MKQISQMVNGPGEAIRPRTLVEVLGKTRVLIEHHKGILGYGTEEIAIGATYVMLDVIERSYRPESFRLRVVCDIYQKARTLLKAALDIDSVPPHSA